MREIEEDMNWPTVIELVEKSLQQNNSFRAIQLLESRIDKTLLSVPREEWKDWIVSYAKALEMDAPRSKACYSAQNLASNPSDIDACIRLSMDLIDAQRLSIGIAVLCEVRQLDPKNTLVLSEIVAALELDGRHKEALKFLEDAPDLVASDSQLTYLLAFNAFFNADIDTPLQLLPVLQKSGDDKIKFMTRRIEQMLIRADFAKRLNGLDRHDERSWHFVLTGGLLINKSRYALSSYDTEKKLFNDIHGLITVLDVWGMIPQKILFPAEHNSEILAHLTGNIIGVPAEKWFASREEGLIAIYDSSYVVPELLKPLRTVYPNQYVFQCVANSAIESPIAPDVLSRFYKRNAPIWGPGFDANNSYVEPREGTPKSIADDIFSSTTQKAKNEDQKELSEFAKAVYEFMPSNPSSSIGNELSRQRLWNGSPSRT